MDKYYKVFGLVFGLMGGLAVMALAFNRHSALAEENKEILAIAANQQIIHSLLGFLAILFHQKLGGFGRGAAFLIIAGIVLFILPVTLKAMGVIDASPTAPYGGFCFFLAWVYMAIAAFKYSYPFKPTHHD